MSSGLPLGTFARQRRDFAHEQCVWNSAFVKGPVPGDEWTIQLWNNATMGWVLHVYFWRVVVDPAGQFGIGWIQEEINPGTGAIGLNLRGDQPARTGVIEVAQNSPINFAPQFPFDAPPAGLQHDSESPLFIIPAGYGLFFDFNPASAFQQVELLYATSIDTSPGRADLT